MIPKKLDYTKDECRGALRHLELQAYSSVISTFRAQGSLDSNKQGVLDQLRKCFHISEDRHKAEVRRVANHEKLTTISEILNGKSYDLEWIREGHRSYPLISRAPSYTALHLLADHASKIAELENTELPTPSETKRERNLSVSELCGVPIVIDDQTKPPAIPTPAIFGISKKDLKRNIDLVQLHPHGKKKHYHHLKPPPPPNMKIQHLYQTLNTKRPRKSFTKKSLKTKNSKQSPGSAAASSRLQFPYPPMLQSSPLSSSDEKQNFDELQRHLTSSQLMPPPMSPMKLNAYTQQQQSAALPTTPSSSKNLLKINHQQQIEPQAHYIPNNRLKSELMAEHHQPMPTSSRARSGRSKSVNVTKGNYSQKYSNGRNNNMDYIPDPQIIFNTSSSKSTMEPSQPTNSSSHIEVSLPIESNDMDLSPAITSPLQLLSTAASCTPKLKINASPNVNHQTSQFNQMPSSTLQTNTTTVLTNQQQPQTSSNALKSVQNRAIKIIPANAKPVIIKPQQQNQPQQQQMMSDLGNKIQPVPQQIITASTGTPSKFKIQKIQLVMNKNQDGTSSTSLSPSATFVSGKAGQLVLSGKGITNTYQVGGPKPPYTILSSAPKVAPKVIVQTIDRNFAQKDENADRIPENQRITENTPIDFLPTSSNTTTSSNTPQTASSFPKVIIPSTANATTTTIAPKQIKLKLGPGSIVNSKIFKGPLPLKIQRNINTKGFTVLNTLNPSQIVQIQSSVPSSSSITSVQPVTTTTAVPKITQSPTVTEITPVASNESTKTDWEQELDDANRSKAAETKERHVTETSNGNAAKKLKLDENVMEIVQSSDDNMIVESTEEEPESSSNVIYAENLPQVEEEEIHEQTPTTTEYLYLNTSDSELKSDNNPEQDINGEEIEETIANGEFDIEERGHNGAEAYENLVKSLTECDGDYMKDMNESQMEENFGLIDSNMLETITFNRESEGLFQ